MNKGKFFLNTKCILVLFLGLGFAQCRDIRHRDVPIYTKHTQAVSLVQYTETRLHDAVMNTRKEQKMPKPQCCSEINAGMTRENHAIRTKKTESSTTRTNTCEDWYCTLQIQTGTNAPTLREQLHVGLHRRFCDSTKISQKPKLVRCS